MLSKVIRALFFKLLWETKENDKDDESVMDSRDSLINSLTFSLSNGDETVVKEAFCLLVDVLIAFKSNLDPTAQLLSKLKEVKKDDVMNEQIKVLCLDFFDCIVIIIAITIFLEINNTSSGPRQALKRHFKELWNEKMEVDEQSDREEEDE